LAVTPQPAARRNLSAELEEPKSAIEGLEGLALEYSWQELQQALGLGLGLILSSDGEKVGVNSGTF